jgi:hypothetical protein
MIDAAPAAIKLLAQIGALTVSLLVLPTAALANAARLDCRLRDVESRQGAQLNRAVGAENRSVTVVFDEQRGTLMLYREGNAQALGDVTITPTSIAGAIDDISLGIDRASGSIVFQTYAPDSMRAEFGECTPSRDSMP